MAENGDADQNGNGEQVLQLCHPVHFGGGTTSVY